MKGLIIILILLACVLLFIFVLPFRLTVLHPILTVKYACIDLFNFFRYKRWHEYKFGVFDCYDADEGRVFGSGKTLSCVYRIRQDFYKYHNKKIYDFQRKKWVTQKIHIITNLTLNNLPYEHLTNLGQIVQSTEKNRQKDIENDTLTCTICLIDECQNQLHSRSFKDNLSPLMLKQLTECRHFNMSIYYDCPRFKQVDALLRQCTSNVVKNNKIWRWQLQHVYDASEIEDKSHLDDCKMLSKTGFFIENDLFEEYDTKEIIDNLVKAHERGDFLSDDEILALQCNSSNLDINNNIKVKVKRK